MAKDSYSLKRTLL